MISPPSQRMDSALEAGSPIALCPYRNTTQVCDINTVTIKDSTSKRSVTANSSRPAVCAPRVPKEKSDSAAGYQLILETVSAVIRPDEHPDPEGGKVAKIEADMICVGSCDDHSRILMRATPHNPDPKDGLAVQTEFAKGGSPIRTPAKFWGPADDPRGDFHLATFFLQPPEAIKSLEFTFERCGLRASGEPVANVRGLVRVYRNEEFELSIILPPWRDHTFRFREAKKGGGYDEKKGIESAQGDDAEKTDAFDDKGTLQSTTYSKGWILKTERKVEWESMNAEIERKIDLAISLKRNGVELETAKSITAIVQNLRLTAEQFTNNVLEITEWLPKVGWSWSVTASFCEGKITGAWGVRAEPAWDTDTAKWVSGYGDLNLTLSIIKLSASAQFGIELSSPDILAWWGAKSWELIAIVKGSIEGKVELEANLPLWGPAKQNEERRQLGGAQGSIKGDLFAQCRVSMMGLILEVKGGFEMGFDIEAEVLQPFRVTMNATRRACVLYFYWTAPGKQRNSPRSEKVLLEQAQLFNDRVLFDSAAVNVAETH